MDDDDRRLLERIQGGDGEAFGVLIDRTHRWLLQCVIVPRVGQSDAEDALSETFHTALAAIGSFEWRGVSLLHWLAAIARRKSLERCRQRSRAPEPLDDFLGALDLADEDPRSELRRKHGGDDGEDEPERAPVAPSSSPPRRRRLRSNGPWGPRVQGPERRMGPSLV